MILLEDVPDVVRVGQQIGLPAGHVEAHDVAMAALRLEEEAEDVAAQRRPGGAPHQVRRKPTASECWIRS